jgi:hypothetical protein
MTEAWEKRLMRLYGLEEGGYARLLAEQGGVCAVCGKRPGRTRLAVDHDHKNGVVRGLLHPRCNRALGPLESTETALVRAIAYLTHALAIRRNTP